LIEAKGVCKEFNKRKRVVALENFNLHVADNEFVSIIGPSGCGKSTFLLLVAGLEILTSGQITCDGVEVKGSDPKRAIVFQEYLLFPWQTVRKNIEFGPKVNGIPADERKNISDKYINLIGLEGFENQYPHELSGGMKQRVAIARALANNPNVLLMDEPFGALDALTREMLQAELLRVWQRAACTVLFVTHSISEAVFLSDRVVIMSNRPGKIISEIRIDLPRPRSRETIFLPEFKEYEKAMRKIIWSEVNSENS
jgi:NitT/TauT family transport system ATP-binding protein